MQTSPTAAQVSVPGFVDHHAHLLRDAAGVRLPADRAGGPGIPSSAWPRRGAARWTCSIRPRTLPDRPSMSGSPPPCARAAAAGLVEITEMGMRSWAYLDALAALQAAGPLPCRVRDLRRERPGRGVRPGRARRSPRRQRPLGAAGGVKFYADGWLVPRTCAPVPGLRRHGRQRRALHRRARARPPDRSRWPSGAGASRPTRSATGPCRPSSTPTTWSSTAMTRRWPRPRRASSTPACCRRS